MTVEHIKQLMDACYLAKRARDMLPPLPDGVQSSYIWIPSRSCRLRAGGCACRT